MGVPERVRYSIFFFFPELPPTLNPELPRFFEGMSLEAKEGAGERGGEAVKEVEGEEAEEGRERVEAVEVEE